MLQLDKEEYYELEEQQSQNDNESVGTKKQSEKKERIPTALHKGKRILTSIINEYFKELKQQFIKSGDEIELNMELIQEVKRVIYQFVAIRHLPFYKMQIKEPKGEDPLALTYIPEMKYVFRYNPKKSKQIPLKIKMEGEFSLPDIATPIPYKQSIYLLDGAVFNQSKNIFQPSPHSYKIHLFSGECSNLHIPILQRIKCCIVRDDTGFFLLGGYVTEYKILTRKCEYYNVKTGAVLPLPSTNENHRCPSGCLHKGQIYLFSDQHLQVYSLNQQTWTLLKKPLGMINRAFQICASVSDEHILIFGGKQSNKDSPYISLYWPTKNNIDVYTQSMPIGMSCQNSWSSLFALGSVFALSTVQSSSYPQVTRRSCTAQVIFIGKNGCFVNSLYSSDDII